MCVLLIIQVMESRWYTSSVRTFRAALSFIYLSIYLPTYLQTEAKITSSCIFRIKGQAAEAQFEQVDGFFFGSNKGKKF